MGLGSRCPVVAVVGASSATQDVIDEAHRVGAAIATAGWHMVCGGGEGVMEAACKGFRFNRNELAQVRNLAIGILPGEDETWANPFVDLVIPTGIGWARNAVITRMAAAVIAVGGGSGTLSELAFAWQMNKPIVALARSGGWAQKMAGVKIDDRRDEAVMSARNADEAVGMLRPILKWDGD